MSRRPATTIYSSPAAVDALVGPPFGGKSCARLIHPPSDYGINRPPALYTGRDCYGCTRHCHFPVPLRQQAERKLEPLHHRVPGSTTLPERETTRLFCACNPRSSSFIIVMVSELRNLAESRWTGVQMFHGTPFHGTAVRYCSPSALLSSPFHLSPVTFATSPA